MTAYIAALREALQQGLALLESAVAQPAGLANDLRAMRQALTDDAAAIPQPTPHHDRPSPGQALDAAALVQRCVASLRNDGALDDGWVTRAQLVLDRVVAMLGVEHRSPVAGKLRGLYVIVDPEVARGDALAAASAALNGGASAIQWRDKTRDKGDQLPDCLRLMEICARHDALLIVNDHADLAAACGAHGVHVGQHDLTIGDARRSLAPGQVVGRSNATLAEAEASQEAGADYLAVGAIYPSPSKANTRPAGLETLRSVSRIARVPVVAISGINESNVHEVVSAGADAVAVISAVVAAEDPTSAARRLVERIEEARARRRPS